MYYNHKNHKSLWYALLATANACIGFLFFTYNITIFGALIPFMQKYIFPNHSEFVVVLVASAPLLTAILGALLGGYLALRIGRRKLMLLTDIIAIGGVVLTLFDLLSTALVGRLLIGFSIGVTTVAAPLYFTELAPVEYRGEFTNAPTIFGAIGILFATLLGLLVPSSLREGETDGTWRVLLSLSILAPLFRIINFLVFFRYETPYYYVNKRKFDKAAKILRKAGTEDIPSRIQEIIKERDYMQQNGQVRFTQLFRKRFRRALLVCIVIMALQYLSGLNLILVFSGGIYNTGVTDSGSHLPQILSVVTSMVNFFAAIFSIWTTSQFGRKPLLVLGTLLAGVCMLIYGILAQAISPQSIAPKIFLVIWPLPWNISLGSVLYVIIAETLPDVGVSLASIFNWIFAFLTLQFFPHARDGMDVGWTFIMYGGITILGALFLFAFLIESRGKNKDEILTLYSGTVISAKVEHQIEVAQQNKETIAAVEVQQAVAAQEAKEVREAELADIEAQKAEGIPIDIQDLQTQEGGQGRIVQEVHM